MIRTASLFLILLFFTATIGLAQKEQKPHQTKLTGFILDAKTNRSIIGASVLLKGTDIGTITDSSGAFALDKLPNGNHTLSVSHISYESKTINNIELNNAVDPIDLTIRLQSKLHAIKGITVTPSYFSIKSNEPTVQQSFTNQEMATVPQIGDDFFRAISRLPGIGSNDFSARITVRGGEFDEVLVTLDGLKIDEPFHVKEVDGGAISFIDVAAIDAIDLMTGGFPAEYGDKMSGVFNLKSKQVKPGKRKFSVGFSLLNFKALSEGRFANNKGSWLVSARRGYIDYVLKLTGDDDQLKPTYYDLYGKVDYQLNSDVIISVNFLHAGDKMRYAGVDNYDGNYLTSRYGNSYGWLRLKYDSSDRLTISTILSYGQVDYSKLWEVFFTPHVAPPIIDGNIRDRRDSRNIAFKTDLEYIVSENYLIKIGLELKKLKADYDYLYQDFYYNAIGPDRIDSIYTIFEKSGRQLSAYLTNRIRLTDHLTTELGARYDYTSYSNDKLISPRLNAVYKFGKSTSIRAGWGYFYQSESINDIYIGDGETDFYPAEQAEHWVLGLQHRFKNNINLRLEAYYKLYSDLRPDMRTSFYSFDPFPEYSSYRTIIYRAKSYSKGIELYLKKNMVNKFSWSLSYALTKAQDSLAYIDFPQQQVKDHYNEVMPTPFDQRHTIFLDIGYRPWSSWQLNVAWQYHTGWPYTDFKRSENSGSIFWGYNGQLQGRYKSFSRVDLRINKYFKIGQGQLTTFIELINIFDKENVRAYDFNRYYRDQKYILEKKPQYWLGLLPSLGLMYQVNF